MRSILVHADRSPAMSVRLECALDLARAMNAHVTVLVDTPVSRYISMDPLGGGHVASEALSQAIADDDSHAAGIEQQLAGQDVAFDVVRSEDDPVEALARAARLCDLVVLSRSSRLAGEVTLAARTPVLVLRDDRGLALPVARACVAWDGGDESALALRNAAPLLATCGNVLVLTVAEKPGGFPATDALRYLSRHGIKADLQEVARSGSTEESLAAAVARAGGELLVMGAWGHSRMREYLFGGVTRYFLEESAGPALLLAH